MSETAKPAAGQPLVPIATLVEFISRALAAAGIPPEDARQVAALMAEADARGGDAHGVFRLPQYVKQIQSGAVNPRPNIRIVSSHAGTALVDGDNALGHLVMKRATELAIEKARQCGVGWVGTRRSNHAGPAQLYPRMAAAQDMIGLYFCVGNANLLPPWGGTEVLLSTNPIAIAVPGLRHPSIVLDMATTNTAFGKIRLKAQRGEPMPEGWMIDREGKPLTDPKRASEGFLRSHRRPERIWAGADDRFAGRDIERRGVWPGRGRLHCGLQNAKQHGAIDRGSEYRGFRGRAILQAERGRSVGRDEVVSDTARC